MYAIFVAIWKYIFRKYHRICEVSYLFPQKHTANLIRFFRPIVTRRLGAMWRAHFPLGDSFALSIIKFRYKEMAQN